MDGDRPHFCFLKSGTLRDFLTYLCFSISSLTLNTMLFSCRTLSHWYISVRLHSLYNAFFSAFHSKQIYITIYFYLHVFENNDSNPSFHEEQLPLIAACSGFGWMFSHKLTGSLHVKTFTQKKKKKL